MKGFCNMENKPKFEVASGRVLREKYGLTAENRPNIQLDPLRVPNQFHAWIRLAERWGISDDLIRDDCLEKASVEEVCELLTFGEVYDAVLNEWLAGPEADSRKPSKEYVAFSALGLAWDLGRTIARERGIIC